MVSEYWQRQGRTEADKRPGKIWGPRSDGSYGCNECCTGDRCDDTSHFDRQSCPFCMGTGTNAITEERRKVSRPGRRTDAAKLRGKGE
jgi:hypothetical protein